MKLKTRTNQPVEGDELDNLKVVGDLEVTGDAKLFENIVDANGNFRFVEGNITTQEITGVSYNYAKWSLSGTHLTLVIFGIVDNNTTFNANDVFGEISLPTYILDKISVLTSNRITERKNVVILTLGGGIGNNFDIYLRKDTSKLVIGHYGSRTITVGGLFRIQFDLLIDAE